MSAALLRELASDVEFIAERLTDCENPRPALAEDARHIATTLRTLAEQSDATPSPSVGQRPSVGGGDHD